jgi:hypothetical protein
MVNLGCRQYAPFLAMGMAIDTFQSKSCTHVFVTHAHEDHIVGLNRHFGGIIFCSLVTQRLLALKFPALVPTHDANIATVCAMVLNTWYVVNDRVSVLALESYHCDGSIMFIFDMVPSTPESMPLSPYRVVYTGDFRFDRNLRTSTLLNQEKVDLLFYDDTFEEVHTAFPSLRQSTQNLVTVIDRLRGDTAPYYIHAGVLGIEPLLRALFAARGHHYRLSSTLQGTVRAAQLQYLLPGMITTDGTILLSTRAIETTQQPVRMAVVASCMYFIGKLPPREDTHPTRRVWYSTHSNATELTRFQCVLAPAQSIACGYSARIP